MTIGSRQFSVVQYGKESSRGTAVAATKILLGQVPAVGIDRKPIRPAENAGVRAESVRVVPAHQYLYNNTLSTEHGYFQQLPMLFGCGLKGGITPSAVTGGGSDYLWPFAPSMSRGTSNSQDSLTIELGDDVQAFEGEFAMFERIRISGKIAQGQDASPVSVEADFFARQLTPTTFTSALSLPSVEPMNAKLARFYLDTSWSGVGGTEKTNILKEFDIEILTGLKPDFSGSGNKYFNEVYEGTIAATANFVFNGNSDADAMYDAQQAGTFQVIRLQINGSTIGAGTPHSLKIDIGGTWDEVSPLGNEDGGKNLHTATFVGHYDATGAKLLDVNVVTNVSSY